MADTDYSIDLRTRSPFWARMASFFVGGRLVSPEKGSNRPGVRVWRGGGLGRQ